jgi:tetratricopeptide (TPR) repeat protein
MSQAQYNEALAAFRTGDNSRARQLSEDLLRDARSAGDGRAEIDGLCMLARVALREGDSARVGELAAEARERADELGDTTAKRMPLHLQAAAARVAGELEEARRLYEESIELNRSLGYDFVAAELHNLAYVELHDGRLERAKELFAQALEEARARGLDSLLPYLVVDRGVLAAEEGKAEAAVRLLSAAEAAFAARGEVIDPDDQAEFDRALEKAEGALDKSAFEAARAAGASLSVDQALG